MDKQHDGGMAFPLAIMPDQKFRVGMSLRDYFAGQALAGMLTTAGIGMCAIPSVAKDAYKYADAMLEARKVTK